MHNLFEQKVTLDTETHTYRHKNGDEYLGFNSVYELISKPFFSGIANKIAQRDNVSVSEVQGKWDAQRDEGTRIDDALTEYAKSGEIKDLSLKPGLDQILSHYSDFHQTHEQLVVFSEKHRTATAIDKLGIFSNRKDSAFAVSDFKCYEAMDLFKGTGWLKEPFNHLPDNKYIKIAFQLSYGAYKFEQLTGRKCKKLFIHMIQPSTIYDEKIHQQIVPVPYMRNDVELFLNLSTPKVLQILSSKSMTISDLI